MACPTCSDPLLRSLGYGDFWCANCGTLIVGQLPGFTPEVHEPQLLEDIQEWRQKYQRPTSKELHRVLRGIRDVTSEIG